MASQRRCTKTFLTEPSDEEVHVANAPGGAFGPASHDAANLVHPTSQIPGQPIYAVSGLAGRPPVAMRLMLHMSDRGRARDCARLNPS